VPEVVARLRAAGAALVRLDELPDPPAGVPWAE
jgi:hypothetical protein